jgi:hypothetical protein
MKFIRHGPEKQGSSRGQGGVWIVLISKEVQDWRSDGMLFIKAVDVHVEQLD